MALALKSITLYPENPPAPGKPDELVTLYPGVQRVSWSHCIREHSGQADYSVSGSTYIQEPMSGMFQNVSCIDHVFVHL